LAFATAARCGIRNVHYLTFDVQPAALVHKPLTMEEETTADATFEANHKKHEIQEKRYFQVGSDKSPGTRGYKGNSGFKITRDDASLGTRSEPEETAQLHPKAADEEGQPTTELEDEGEQPVALAEEPAQQLEDEGEQPATDSCTAVATTEPGLEDEPPSSRTRSSRHAVVARAEAVSDANAPFCGTGTSAQKQLRRSQRNKAGSKRRKKRKAIKINGKRRRGWVDIPIEKPKRGRTHSCLQVKQHAHGYTTRVGGG
jgi:hypothetical protein